MIVLYCHEIDQIDSPTALCARSKQSVTRNNFLMGLLAVSMTMTVHNTTAAIGVIQQQLLAIF
jgi:hypothetical protein